MRPTVSLTGDDWFGHRDVWGNPVGDKNERIDWDFALIHALQVIEEHTDSDGLLIWEYDVDGVNVTSEKKINKFHASVEKKTSKDGYKASPGERWLPRVKRVNGELPTFKEWRESKASEDVEEDGSW